MKQFYIKNKNDYLKIFKRFLIVLLIMSLPIIIPFSWKWLWELFGESINEGNSAIFSLFWFSLITLPAGGILLIGTILVVIWDTIAISVNRK